MICPARAPLLLSATLGSAMAERGYGSIVNISSKTAELGVVPDRSGTRVARSRGKAK